MWTALCLCPCLSHTAMRTENQGGVAEYVDLLNLRLCVFPGDRSKA